MRCIALGGYTRGGFEVRVFRAKARKREAIKWDLLKELGLDGVGFW